MTAFRSCLFIMSDDGFYAGSPYDDADDLYYDDVGEHLADDLAEHTLPSPIYHEDPAYEMLEYYSDWEYYSDDYYDDDPALLRGNAQDGSSTASKRKASTEKAPAKGKKRKLADTQNIPDLTLDDRPALAATVRGTVWAGSRPQSPKPYEVGHGPRVALLKNWKQVFGRSSPRSTFKPDESWANDLSLEDMGLRKVEGDLAQGGTAPVDDELEEGDDENIMENGPYQIDRNHDEAEEDSYEGVMEESDAEEMKPNKRQRIVTSIPSPPPSNGSTNTSTETMVESMRKTSMTSIDGEEQSKSSRVGVKKRVYPELAKAKAIEIAETTVKTRKRKASPDAEPSDTAATKSTASSRAKRVASSKLASVKQEKPPPMPATRATRSRKK